MHLRAKCSLTVSNRYLESFKLNACMVIIVDFEEEKRQDNSMMCQKLATIFGALTWTAPTTLPFPTAYARGRVSANGCIAPHL